MIELVDLNVFERYPKVYGGNAGRKICILDDDNRPWMVKYPEPTRGMRGDVASYTTSPLSEYLGSHIYELAGIDVHNTVLGFRDGRVVVACEDFTYPDRSLLTFHDLKNSISDDLAADYVTRPSDGRSVYLSDVLTAIDSISADFGETGMLERFWDMFVMDTLIGNADRNNENWGLLTSRDESFVLAPVYDNGNAFFNKRRDLTMEQRLADEEALKHDAMSAARTCFLRDDGHHISPLKYISSGIDLGCTAAVRRLVDTLDLHKVNELIDELPEETLSYVVMPRKVKEFHKEVLRRRFEEVLVPTAKAHHHPVSLSAATRSRRA